MTIPRSDANFYNPDDPKCRACKFWSGKLTETRMAYLADCSHESSGKTNCARYHCAKACENFVLIDMEEA